MNFKDWSAVLGTWVSISAAVMGGYLALQSYQADVKTRAEDVAKRADARVVQTFALAEQFQSGDFLRVRSKLIATFNTPGPIPTAERVKRLGAMADQDLWAFVDFFDTVQICVDQGLCDAALAWRLFNPYAGFWFGALRPAIDPVREFERSKGADYTAGYGLEMLSKPKEQYGAAPQR